MKDLPILFKGPMVCALLDDRKTQTRRIMKPQPVSVEYWLRGERSDRLHGLPSMRDESGQGWSMCGPFRCPYIAEGMYAGECGKLGNSRRGDTTERKSLLWVKETYRFASDLDAKSPSAIGASALDAGYRTPWAPIKYVADGATANADVLDDFGGAWGRTRVSIHMPRWASRIRREVVGIRVERIQDITEEDAIAEGLKRVSKDDGRTWKYGIPDRDGLPGQDDHGWPWHEWEVSPIKAFRKLWDSINAEPTPVTGDDGRISHYVSYPWEERRETRTHRGKPWHVIGNPWVWAISFERVESEVRS